MNLSQNNYYKGRVTKRFTMFKGTDKEFYSDTCYTRYTYESYKMIYDVDVRNTDQDKTYHINCGFATEPNVFHKAIEKHFSL